MRCGKSEKAQRIKTGYRSIVIPPFNIWSLSGWGQKFALTNRKYDIELNTGVNFKGQVVFPFFPLEITYKEAYTILRKPGEEDW